MKSTSMRYFMVDSSLQDKVDDEWCWKLNQVLYDARDEGTLVYGLFSAGKLLERNPQGADLCVMSKEDDDVDPGAGILMYLLESLCWANRTPVVRVQNFRKVLESFGIRTVDGNTEFNEHCLLIKGKEGKPISENLKCLRDKGFEIHNKGQDFEVDAG